jgi:hypothetical protein
VSSSTRCRCCSPHRADSPRSVFCCARCSASCACLGFTMGSGPKSLIEFMRPLSATRSMMGSHPRHCPRLQPLGSGRSSWRSATGPWTGRTPMNPRAFNQRDLVPEAGPSDVGRHGTASHRRHRRLLRVCAGPSGQQPQFALRLANGTLVPPPERCRGVWGRERLGPGALNFSGLTTSFQWRFEFAGQGPLRCADRRTTPAILGML